MWQCLFDSEQSHSRPQVAAFSTVVIVCGPADKMGSTTLVEDSDSSVRRRMKNLRIPMIEHKRTAGA